MYKKCIIFCENFSNMIRMVSQTTIVIYLRRCYLLLSATNKNKNRWKSKIWLNTELLLTLGNLWIKSSYKSRHSLGLLAKTDEGVFANTASYISAILCLPVALNKK